MTTASPDRIKCDTSIVTPRRESPLLGSTRRVPPTPAELAALALIGTTDANAPHVLIGASDRGPVTSTDGITVSRVAGVVHVGELGCTTIRAALIEIARLRAS
jgi:hypothetical protein